MKKLYATIAFALMAMTSFAEEQNDTTYVTMDFNMNPWNYPLTTEMKGWGPNYDDETGAIFNDTDFTWPVAEGSDKLITVTVYAVDLDEYPKPSVYATVDNDGDGQAAGYTEDKINVLFTNNGTTMRFKTPEGYKFGKLVFYNFHTPNFLVGDEYEEEFEYELNNSTFKHKLKVWTPSSPKKNSYGYDIWDGDDTNILFNYPYFNAHFMKIDMRLVPDGTSTPDIPDGISEQIVNSQWSNSKWFDLQGREVKAAKKGIYISNGRKIVK